MSISFWASQCHGINLFIPLNSQYTRAGHIHSPQKLLYSAPWPCNSSKHISVFNRNWITVVDLPCPVLLLLNLNRHTLKENSSVVLTMRWWHASINPRTNDLYFLPFLSRLRFFIWHKVTARRGGGGWMDKILSFEEVDEDDDLVACLCRQRQDVNGFLLGSRPGWMNVQMGWLIGNSWRFKMK